MFNMCQYDRGTQKVLKSKHPLSGENYLSFAQKLKQTGLDNGIICNQLHAPFPSSCRKIHPYLKRAIECTAEAGGQICIIHRITINLQKKMQKCILNCFHSQKSAALKLQQKTCETGIQKRMNPPLRLAPRRKAFACI